MKKTAVSTIAVASVLLAACTQTMLTKPGVTPSQFEADKADCQMKFMASPWATNPFMAVNFGKTCMRAKGYTQVN
ncbi:MAG TPA: hypothetical protein VF292_16190 [Rhodanobacteraceae bacterium]